MARSAARFTQSLRFSADLFFPFTLFFEFMYLLVNLCYRRVPRQPGGGGEGFLTLFLMYVKRVERQESYFHLPTQLLTCPLPTATIVSSLKAIRFHIPSGIHYLICMRRAAALASWRLFILYIMQPATGAVQLQSCDANATPQERIHCWLITRDAVGLWRYINILEFN